MCTPDVGTVWTSAWMATGINPLSMGWAFGRAGTSCGKRHIGSKSYRSFMESPYALWGSVSGWWLSGRSGLQDGVFSHKIHRSIGVTFRSAWFMLHRIRQSLHKDSTVKVTAKLRRMRLSSAARRATCTLPRGLSHHRCRHGRQGCCYGHAPTRRGSHDGCANRKKHAPRAEMIFATLAEQTLRHNVPRGHDGPNRLEKMMGNVAERRLTYSRLTGLGAATSHQGSSRTGQVQTLVLAGFLCRFGGKRLERALGLGA